MNLRDEFVVYSVKHEIQIPVGMINSCNVEFSLKFL